MNESEKNGILKRYLDSAEPLLSGIASCGKDAIDFKPAVDDAWTIREHLAHFFHADVFCYTRAGLAITEPGTTLFVWDENLWNTRVKPDFMDTESLIGTVRALRKSIAALAGSVPASGWDAAVANHPKRGLMKLQDILALYADHAVFHMKYVNRNLEALKTGA